MKAARDETEFLGASRHIPLFDERREFRDRRSFWQHKAVWCGIEQRQPNSERRVEGDYSLEEAFRVGDSIPLIDILLVTASGGIWL